MLLQRSLLLCLLLTTSVSGFAQRSKAQNNGKSMYTRDRFNYSSTQVKGSKAKIVCPVFENSKYPYHGFGFKLGDPFAFTYKFYPSKRYSFALDVGKPASSLYNRYFREKFDTYAVRDTISSSEARLQYLTHKVKTDFIGEAKFLYHFDIRKIATGLQLYVGGGWQWKNTKLQYDYQYEYNDLTSPLKDKVGRFERNRFTMGPQIVMGIEYSYFQIPLSAFMELEYSSDVMVDPGYSRIEGGVGLRYIF